MFTRDMLRAFVKIVRAKVMSASSNAQFLASLQCSNKCKTVAQSGDLYLHLRRPFSTSCYLSSSNNPKSTDGFRVISPQASTDVSTKKLTSPLLQVTFVLSNGERLTAKGREGDSLLDVIVDNDLDIDGFGACEGTLACSTCHVILKQEDYDKLPSKPRDEEMDMLDLAFDLSDTSRLGCQIYLSKNIDKIEVQVPATVNDVRLT